MQLPPVFNGDTQHQRAHQKRDNQLLTLSQSEHCHSFFQ